MSEAWRGSKHALEVCLASDDTAAQRRFPSGIAFDELHCERWEFAHMLTETCVRLIEHL